MSSLDVKESKIAHPSGPGRSLVADLRRSKPYRDLRLCAHPIGKKNRFLRILDTDVSR